MGEWRKKRRRSKNKKIIITCSSLALLLLVGAYGVWLSQDKPATSTVSPAAAVDYQAEIPKAVEKSFYEKLSNSEVIRVLVIGDSIGASSGAKNQSEKWTSLLTQGLKEKYNSTVFFENLSVGGSTVYGGYSDYLKKDKILKDQYDLAIICFGQNDQGSLSLDQYGAIYERLIRTVKADRGNPEVMGIIESSIKNPTYPNKLIELSQHYNFPVVDTREAFEKSGAAYNTLTDDGVHPNSAGYQLYKNQLMQVINNNLDSGREVPELQESTAYLYNSQPYSDLKNYYSFSSEGGFQLNNAYVSNKVGSYIETSFTGQTLGLSLRKDTASGILNIYVDDKLIKEYDMYSATPYNFIYLVSDSLTDGEHKLRLEISNKKNKESTANEVKLYEIFSK